LLLSVRLGLLLALLSLLILLPSGLLLAALSLLSVRLGLLLALLSLLILLPSGLLLAMLLLLFVGLLLVLLRRLCLFILFFLPGICRRSKPEQQKQCCCTDSHNSFRHLVSVTVILDALVTSRTWCAC